MWLAPAWSERSTCSAVLTETIAACAAMREGSFVDLGAGHPQPGVLIDPARRARASRTGTSTRSDVRDPSAPSRSSSITPSLIISDQIASSRLSESARSVASGTWPMPSCSVEPSSTRLATSSAICSACSCEAPDGRRGEIFLHLDRQVDQILRQLAVAERVRHPRVHLRDHQAAACAHRFDRGGEDVHLDPERDLSLARGRGVQQHDVGRTHRREQPRDERQAHRQVVQPLAGVAHPGPDERRLEDHAVALGQRAPARRA